MVCRYCGLLCSVIIILDACSPLKKVDADEHLSNENTAIYRESKHTTVPIAIEPATYIDKVEDRNAALQKKYGKHLNVPAESLGNTRLYAFIDEWMNVPYKWGGTDKKGIDCSAFIRRLLNEVYNLKIPRTSITQLYTQRVELFRSDKYLSEGDILFFRTMENRVVSHVGIYLHNNKFVNSGSSRGVCIESLNDPYWRRRFVVAGRVIVRFAKD